MPFGFYIIMAAQFFSSLADNALLVAAIALLLQMQTPEWMTPLLKFFFTVSYVVFAAFVGAFADSMPKGRVMFITNMVKIAGCLMMFFHQWLTLPGVAPLRGGAARIQRGGAGRRGLLAGQIRHPHGIPAAPEARRRERLDRGPYRRFDHSGNAARRRARKPGGVFPAARVRFSGHRDGDRFRLPKPPSR